MKKIKSRKENHKKYKRIIIIFYGGCYSCCYTYNIPQNILYISFINTNKFFTDLSRLRIDFFFSFSIGEQEIIHCKRNRNTNQNYIGGSDETTNVLDFNVSSFLFLLLLHNIDNDLL